MLGNLLAGGPAQMSDNLLAGGPAQLSSEEVILKLVKGIQGLP